jgi:hypothetical protein
MPVSKQRRRVPTTDPLREKLDRLAERAIDRVLAKGDDATLREITETLKTVADYRGRTQTGDPADPAASAWEKYRGAINGKSHAAAN